MKSTDSERKLTPLKAALPSLEDYQGPDQVVTSQQLRHEFKSMPKQTCIMFKPSFFPTVVRSVEGFSAGELIVISGPTKTGKTLLAQSFTYAFAQSGIDSLWFSYEVPARQFIESFPDDMFPKFFLPREIHSQNIGWLEQRIIEAWEKFRCRVVFIDHLHFLFDMAKIRNASLDIGGYVRRLKRFAVQNDLIIFLLTHITKADPSEEISYNKIRDSSLIPQESDSVFLIRRLARQNEAELTVCFHRRTGCLNVKVPLIKHSGYLYEKDTTQGGWQA